MTRPGLVALFVLVALPILEIVLLLKLGAALGVLATVGVVIGTGVLGVLVIRSRSLAVARRAFADSRSGRQPVGREVVDTALVLIAGVCLVAPGPLTDSLGLLLLVPPIRAAVVRALARRIEIVEVRARRAGAAWPGDGATIDGSYERVDDEPPPPPPDRPRRPLRPPDDV